MFHVLNKRVLCRSVYKCDKSLCFYISVEALYNHGIVLITHRVCVNVRSEKLFYFLNIANINRI